jgi:hypothetical protein
MVSRGLAGSALALWLGLSACDSAPVKACHAEMQTSQQALLEMDKTDAGSVAATLGLIERTLTTCKTAGRGDEVSDLADAKRQVAAHLSALEKRAERPTRSKLTPEALAELLKKGDPDCPRGQGYEPAGTKQVVKCTGPQLAELGSAQARDYFDKRGYRLSPPDATGGFKAEFGASAYVFHYAEGAPLGPPRCLEVTGRPGTPWQEIVARLSGVHPDRLVMNEPIRIGSRTVALRVSGDPQQWSVGLGECEPQAQAH